MARILLYLLLWPFLVGLWFVRFIFECVQDTAQALASCKGEAHARTYVNPVSNIYVGLKYLSKEALLLDLSEFQERVINRGITAVKREYTEPHHVRMVQGAIMGFEACRGKTPEELRLVWETANLASVKARKDMDPDLSWYKAYEEEVHWVCNCVSVILMERGDKVILAPTKRGMLGAAGVLGLLG